MSPRSESLQKPRVRDHLYSLAAPVGCTIIAVACDIIARWAHGPDQRAVLYCELFFLFFAALLFAAPAVTGKGGGVARDRHRIEMYRLPRVRFGNRYRIATAMCACVVLVRLVMQLVAVVRMH